MSYYKEDKKCNDCDCECQRICRFPFFPIPRDASCQSLVSLANTVLGLPGSTTISFTTTTTTTTVSGTYLGFDTTTGSVIIFDGVRTRSFRLSEICTISAGGL